MDANNIRHGWVGWGSIFKDPQPLCCNWATGPCASAWPWLEESQEESRTETRVRDVTARWRPS